MPFGAIPVIGAGAGAAAGMEGIQQNQLRQQDLLAQLMMHAQQVQAQREQIAAYREATLSDKQERTRIAQERANEQEVNNIPGETRMSGADVQALGPAARGRFSPESTLPSTQYGGWSQIQPTGQPTVGGQTGSASTGEVQAQTQPSLPTGMFTKNLSDAEQERKSRDAATDAQRQFTNAVTMRRIGDTEGTAAGNSDLNWFKALSAIQRGNQAAGAKGWHIEKTEGQNGPVFMRMNDATGDVKPMSTDDFKPPMNSTTANRVTSAKTVRDVGNDLINQLSKPEFAAKVGPAMGRFNHLRDFIGNPPPEFNELAGAIDSFALANMGVHGMRSAQGAEMIRKLEDGHHTPESLIAGIRGLMKFSNNFISEAQGKGPADQTQQQTSPNDGFIVTRQP